LRLCVIANIAALNGATAGATVKGSGVAVVAFLAGSFDVVATHFDASSLSADNIGADPSVLLCAVPASVAINGVAVVADLVVSQLSVSTGSRCTCVGRSQRAPTARIAAFGFYCAICRASILR